jgi:hypothetical protein
MRLRPCLVHGLDGSSRSKALSSQGPGAFYFCAVTRISATRLRHGRNSHVGLNPTQARAGRAMMTVGPRCEVPAARRVEIGSLGRSAPSPLHPLEAPSCISLWRLLRAVHPRLESAMNSCFHGSFTNVFDVKANVRVMPISSYDQRCVVLPFHTIVDAPCPPRCNRA